MVGASQMRTNKPDSLCCRSFDLTSCTLDHDESSHVFRSMAAIGMIRGMHPRVPGGESREQDPQDLSLPFREQVLPLLL